MVPVTPPAPTRVTVPLRVSAQARKAAKGQRGQRTRTPCSAVTEADGKRVLPSAIVRQEGSIVSLAGLQEPKT